MSKTGRRDRRLRYACSRPSLTRNSQNGRPVTPALARAFLSIQEVREQ
jgi:hypothetical protein